jgi:hypothetical protein
MAGFGKPSASTAPANTGDDDNDLAGMGLGEDAATPLGVFPATCQGLKVVKSDKFHGVVLSFALDHNGDEYAIMAPQIDADMDGKERKRAKDNWHRIGQALRAMGVATNNSTQLPLRKADADGRRCRLAVSTWDKQGVDTPTIVLGRPKLRVRQDPNGGPDVQVGFDPALADAAGKCLDYGCGVLPPA